MRSSRRLGWSFPFSGVALSRDFRHTEVAREPPTRDQLEAWRLSQVDRLPALTYSMVGQGAGKIFAKYAVLSWESLIRNITNQPPASPAVGRTSRPRKDLCDSIAMQLPAADVDSTTWTSATTAATPSSCAHGLSVGSRWPHQGRRFPSCARRQARFASLAMMDGKALELSGRRLCAWLPRRGAFAGAAPGCQLSACASPRRCL